MRKVFFSFVATLAFGSFAMANNVDFESVEAVSVEYLNAEEPDCDATYNRVKRAHLSAGASQQQAVQAATIAYSQCANPEYHK